MPARPWRVFLLLVLALGLAAGCVPSAGRVCAGQACFAVDVVSSDEGREKGLMFRRSLQPGTGMLFVFDREGVYPFWMKNMSFPIDILWLDKDKRVVHVEADVPACLADPCPVYTPSAQARYVLELPAGDARCHNLGPGVIFSGG